MGEPGIIASLIPLILLLSIWFLASRLRQRRRSELSSFRDPIREISQNSAIPLMQSPIMAVLAGIAACIILAGALFLLVTIILRFGFNEYVPYAFDLVSLVGVGAATALSISANNSPLIGRKKTASNTVSLFNKFGTTLVVAALSYATLQSALQSLQFDERYFDTDWPVGPFQLSVSIFLLLATALSVFRILEHREDT